MSCSVTLTLDSFDNKTKHSFKISASPFKLTMKCGRNFPGDYVNSGIGRMLLLSTSGVTVAGELDTYCAVSIYCPDQKLLSV